jgi:hypothetical protein
MASQNPPWLDALLAQAYPGVGNDMSAFPGAGQLPSSSPRAGADITNSLSPWSGPMPGQNAGLGMGNADRLAPIQNVDERLLPAGPNSPSHAWRPPVSGPPRPNPSNVGGAPSPGIPAPLGANRTGNNLNPNYSLVQYGVGGGAQGPRNAPIYTAGNFGGPQNAGWGQQGQFPQQAQPQQQPRGALAANPQGGGSGFNVGGMFQNLPDDIFNNSPQPSMNKQGSTGTPYGPSPNALPQAQKYGWPFQMVG